MTAPYVATVTKQPAGPAGRSRMQRTLLMVALLLPLLLAIALLAWMAVPKAGEGTGRADWMDRMFGKGENGAGVIRIGGDEDVCSLPKDIGPCRGAMPRYFFSTQTGACESFLYGGCHGNGNNFETLDECTSRCGGPAAGAGERQAEQRVDCSLPKTIGPCRGAMPRFFYSTESGACQSFLYGGCKGNANNFETIEECTDRCGGPAGSSSERQLAQRVACSLPKTIGPCRGGKPRYFFSTESGVCEFFLYGGCQGNANNFETMEECNAHCGVEDSSPDKDDRHEDSAAICSLPVKAGDCRGMIPRYFYNTERSNCMEFNYSGCGGNGNNFETLHDCEKMCITEKAGTGSTNTSDCSSAPDGGLCMAYMERYAFNPSTGSCEKFVYGGCGGNGNRYSSVEECEEHCGSGEHNTTGEPGLQEATSEASQQEQQDVSQTEQPGDNDDYDTRVCGVTECPMDCGFVRHDGDCVLCQCAPSPLVQEPVPVPSA